MINMKNEIIDYSEWLSLKHVELIRKNNFECDEIKEYVHEFYGENQSDKSLEVEEMKNEIEEIFSKEELKTEFITILNKFYQNRWASNEDIINEIDSIKSGVYHDKIKKELNEVADIKMEKNREAIDILKRYKEIKLHAMFLFTDEDEELIKYINKNWNNIDKLSGEFCDLHPSKNQMECVNDGYDIFDKSNILKANRFNAVSEMPGIYFWNNSHKGVFISLKKTKKMNDITESIRTIFEEVRKNNKIESVEKARKILVDKENKKLKKADKILGSITGIIFILMFFYIIIRNEPFADKNLVTLTRTILSLSIALVGASVPGFLNITWTTKKGFAIRAGGALALFTLTYLFTPQVL